MLLKNIVNYSIITKGIYVNAQGIILDRDGVINKDVSYLYKISDLEWVDGAKEALAYAYSKGYDLIVVTNQSGVARGYYKESDVQILHDHMAHELDRSGAPILHFIIALTIKKALYLFMPSIVNVESQSLVWLIKLLRIMM